MTYLNYAFMIVFIYLYFFIFNKKNSIGMSSTPLISMKKKKLLFSEKLVTWMKTILIKTLLNCKPNYY